MANNVENRIVQLKFENEQFESAVAKTMTTLEKFKEKLKFDDNKGLDGLKKATSNYNYSLNDIGQSLDQLNGKFSTMGTIGRRVIENLTDSAYRLATKGLGTITGAITQGGLNRAKNLEQARFQLQGIFHDAEKVREVIYSDILPELRGTPFGLDEAAVVVGQLAASGVKADEDIKQATRAMAGLAAMSGKSFQDVGRVFSKVAGQGNMMGGELQQLSTYGINAAADLANYFNKVADGSVQASDTVKKHVADIIEAYGAVDEASVRDAASKRMVYYEDLVAAMDTTYGAHAKAANDIFSGAFANFKAALARIGAEPAAVGLEVMRNAFNAMSPAIDAVNDVLTPFTSSTRAIVKVGDEMKYAGEMSGTLSNRVLEASYGFQKLFVKLDDSHQFMKYTEDNIGSLTKTVKEFDEEGNEVIKHVTKWGRTVKVGDTILNDNMWKIVTSSTKSFVNILSALGKVLGAIGKGFKAAMPKVTLRMVAKITDGFEKFTEQLILSKENLDRLKNIAQAVFTPLGIAVRIAGIFIKGFVIAMQTLYRAFKPATNAAFSFIGSIGKMVSNFGGLFDNIECGANKIAYFIGTIIGAISRTLQFNKIINFLRSGFEFLSNVLNKIAWNVGYFIGRLVGSTKGVTATISEILHLKEIGEALYKVFSKFKQGISKMLHLDELGAAMKPIINSFKEFFSQDNLFGKFIENIKNFIEYVRELEWTKKILDGVSGGFERLTGAVSKITKGPASKIKGWLSKVSKSLKEMFASYADGEFFMTVMANLVPLYGSMQQQLSSFNKKVKPFIQTIGDLVLSIFKFESFSDMVSSIVSGIKRLITSFGEFLGLIGSKTGGKAANALGDSIKGIFSSIGDKAAGFGATFKDVGSGFASFIQSIVEMFKSLDSDTAQKFIKTIGMYVIAFLYIKKLYKMSKSAEQILSITANIGRFTGSLASGFGIKNINLAIANSIKLIGLAFSLVLFAAALKKLGSMDLPTLLTGAGTAIAALIVFYLILRQLDKQSQGDIEGKANKRLLAISALVASMAGSIYLISLAMERIGSMDPNAMWRSLIAVGALLGAFVGIFAILNHFDKTGLKGDVSKRWSSAAFSMVGLAKGIEMMSVAVEKLGSLDHKVLKKGVIAVIGLMAAMSLFASSVKADAKVFSSAIGMLALAGAVIIIVKAIQLMQTAMQGENFVVAAVLVGVIIGALAGFAYVCKDSYTDILASGAGMLLLSRAIVILVGAIAVLGLLPIDVLENGLISIAALLIGVITFASVANGDVLKASAGILILSIALGVLTKTLITLASIPIGQVLSGLFKAAIILGVVGLGLVYFSKALKGLDSKGAATLLIISVAILALATALYLLAGVPLLALAIALGVLAVALLVIGGILTVFSGLSVGMLAVAAAFAVLGIAVLFIAAAFMLFVMALAAIVPLLLSLSLIDMDTLNAGLTVLKTVALGLMEALLLVGAGLLVFGLACGIAGIGVALLAVGFGLLGIAGFICSLAIISLAAAIVVFTLAIRSLFGEGVLSGVTEGISSGLGKMKTMIKDGLFGGLKSLFTSGGKENGKELADAEAEGYIEGTVANQPEIDNAMLSQFSGENMDINSLMQQNGMDAADAQAFGFTSEATANQPEIDASMLSMFGGENTELTSFMQQNGMNLADAEALGFTSGTTANQSDIDSAVANMYGNTGTIANTTGINDGQQYIAGFTNPNNTTSAGEAGEALATATANGASTSSSTSDSGKKVGRGFAMGVLKETDKSKKSGSKLASAASSGAAKSTGLSTSGRKHGRAYHDGILKEERGSRRAGRGLADAAGSAASKNKWGKTEGQNAAQGYASGISSWVKKVADAAANLVRKAKQAAKNEQHSNSPSKDFIEFGRWADEGYIIGLKSLSGKVSKTSAEVVEGGMDSFHYAMNSMLDALSTDADFVPTITPVVDLSNVDSGVKYINDSFGSMPLNLNNALLASQSFGDFRNQNRQNSEISRLARTLDSMTESMNSRALNNYITVDGSGDPEAFADGLIRSFRLNARTI